MEKIFCCTNLLSRLCGRRKILSTRMLLRLLVLLQVLFVVLIFRTFIFLVDSDIVRNNFVYQSNLLPGVLPKMAAQAQMNKTLAVVTLQTFAFTTRGRTKQPAVVTVTPTKRTPITAFTNENATDKSPQGTDCQTWCHRKENSSKPFFLTAVLLVRIYVKDLPQLSTRELRQWFYYLRYAGFQHVYVYDAFVMKNESQAKALKPLIDEGFVTYVDWSHKAFPYSIDGTQHSAYQDCINRFGHQTQWQAAIDMDEYPFSPTDQQPWFVLRAVARISGNIPDASELTMQNFLFLGKPLDERKHPFLIDRIWRRTHGPANALVKPIYKPGHVGRARVHHNALAKGRSTNFPVDQLRLNHYWGARLQNWGEDTPEIVAKTQPDHLIESIVKTLQTCISECVPSAEYLYQKQWN